MHTVKTQCTYQDKYGNLTMQQSLNLLASTGVVKLSPHSCSERESFQWTKHSDACVMRVPETWGEHTVSTLTFN